MGNQDKEKKCQRVNSSDAKAETNEEAMDSQDGTLISLMITEYQVLIAKLRRQIQSKQQSNLEPRSMAR